MPWAIVPDALLAVLDHLAQLGELGREVDDAERGLAAAVDVAAVDGPIVVEELEVLLLHGGMERLQVGLGRRGPRAEEGLVEHRGELPVALVAQMDAVDRQRLVGRLVQLLAGREQVDEDHAVLAGQLGHGVGVELDVLVVLLAVGDVRVLEVFVGDRREQDQLGADLPLYLVVVDSLMKFSRSLLNFGEPGRPGERFVEAEGGEQDVGLLVLERMAVVVEMGLARPQRQLVGRIAQVVDHQLELGEAGCAAASRSGRKYCIRSASVLPIMMIRSPL